MPTIISLRDKENADHNIQVGLLKINPACGLKRKMLRAQHLHGSLSFFLSFFQFYWSILDIQCSISFRCTAKVTQLCTYICSLFLGYFPIQATIEYEWESPVLYSRSLLVILYIVVFTCQSLISQLSFPSLSPFPANDHKFVFYFSGSIL